MTDSRTSDSALRGPVLAFARFVFRLLFRVRVRGVEHLQGLEGPALITPNHQSFLDAALLTAFLPDMSFAIDTNIAKMRLVRPFLRFAHTVPVDPTNPFGARVLSRALAEGKKVCVFPEGRITVTGGLMKVSGGPGMLADKADCPVVPIVIDGAQHSLMSRMRGRLPLQLFPRISVTVMRPRRTPPVDGLFGKRRRAVLKAWLTDQMVEAIFAAYEPPETLTHALLEVRATTGPGLPALQDGIAPPVSYRALVARAAVLGDVLTRDTVPGEPVALLLPTASGAAATFFGLVAHGRPPALLNFTAGAEALRGACRAARVRIVVTSREFVEKGRLQPLVDKLAEDYRIVYLEDVRAGLALADKLRAITALVAPRLVLPRAGRAHDPAVILFTSGSEGPPKGVALSHANLLSNIAQVAAAVDFNRSDKVFNCLPMFHSFGLTGGILLPVLRGVHSVLYPNPRHIRMVPELLYHTDCTVLFGTDFFLSAWAKVADPYDFRSVRMIVAGAERVRDETRETYAERLRTHVLEGYGTTETSPVIAVNTPARHRRGSVGRPLPGIETDLVPVEGIETGGRLRVRGPNVMLGYMFSERPGAIQPPEGGWHDTGDIVEIDAEGYIHIVGRQKRFAKVAGEMIALGTVEELARAVDPQAAHAAVAVPDPRRGERILLATTSETLDRDALLAAGRRLHAPELAQPRAVVRVETIPLLGTGKTDYPAVTRMLNEAAEADADD
ncbi:MAG: AMP-binding protein [Alphaproteobacteria bacterium]